MSMKAKISCLNRVEKALSSQITADSMNKALRVMSDVFEGYEVEEIPTGAIEQDDLMECYLDAMKVQGLSPKTLAHYERTIRKLKEKIRVPMRQVTVYHIRGWLAEEQKRGISLVTLDGNRQVFSAFFGWLHREGLIERNPMGNIGTIKCEKRRKEIYTPVEIEKLNEECVHLMYSVRNRAIVEFLRSTGCRISEMIGLNRKDVNFSTLEATVFGKGRKERKVYMSEVAGMVLKQYLEERKDDDPALFLSRQGKRLQPGGVRCMLNKLAGMAEVEHVHPHKFRRTLATNLNRRGMPIQEVAHILGHEKLDTTMKYVMLNDNDVGNDYRRINS